LSGEIVDRHSLVHRGLYRQVYKLNYGAPLDWDNNPSNGIQAPPGDPDILYQQENLANPAAPIRGLVVPWSGSYLWDVTSPNVTTLANAHWVHLKDAYDFFSNVHGRDSFDDAGAYLVSG